MSGYNCYGSIRVGLFLVPPAREIDDAHQIATRLGVHLTAPAAGMERDLADQGAEGRLGLLAGLRVGERVLQLENLAAIDLVKI